MWGQVSGKTTGIAIACVYEFLKCRRVLYGAPTGDQIAKFWAEVKSSLREPLDAGILVKNETFHTIEMPGTDMRIRAKTCWNADTLRGDYADFLVLDEWQLMAEDTWEQVGAPMLHDPGHCGRRASEIGGVATLNDGSTLGRTRKEGA